MTDETARLRILLRAASLDLADPSLSDPWRAIIQRRQIEIARQLAAVDALARFRAAI